MKFWEIVSFLYGIGLLWYQFGYMLRMDNCRRKKQLLFGELEWDDFETVEEVVYGYSIILFKIK